MRIDFKSNTPDFVNIIIKDFGKMKIPAIEKLSKIFAYFGGNFVGNIENDYEFSFPIMSFSNRLIEEVIKNTCFECGGLMKNSTALRNTLISHDDFGGDAGQRGTTQSRTGHPNIINVRKCSSCGHSHT